MSTSAPTTTEKIMARDAVPRSNTEAGQRILKDAPPERAAFKEFAGFLAAVLAHKLPTVDLLAPVPESLSAHLDLVFQKGDDYELKLDLYTPKHSAGPLPLVVLIHGGCWVEGSRGQLSFYGVKLAQLGYAAASIDYRLADAAPYPAGVDDCRSAIQWLKDNARAYNIDPDRVALFGGSAGGHLVELIGYAASTPTKQHPSGPGPDVKAIVSFYGWSDLTDPSVREPYWNEAWLGKKYADDPELYKEASPINYVSRQSPPTILLQGTIDRVVPMSQSVKLADKLEANNVPYIYAPFQGQFHAFDFFQDTTERAMYLTEKFLAEYL